MNKITIGLLILLASCSVSHVDRFPGKSLPEFPTQLQGLYKLHPGGFRALFAGRQLDSMLVRVSATNTETLSNNGWSSDFKIDADNVLSQLGTYYFLSKKDLAEPQYWNTTVIWQADDDLYLASINETDRNLLNDKLKNYLSLNLQLRKKNQVSVQKVNNANKAMLKALSTITADSRDSVLFYSMNDSMLVQFIKREIGTKNAIRFQKINSTR